MATPPCNVPSRLRSTGHPHCRNPTILPCSTETCGLPSNLNNRPEPHAHVQRHRRNFLGMPRISTMTTTFTRRISLFLLTALSLNLASVNALAELEIQITRGAGNQAPIAIVPFG